MTGSCGNGNEPYGAVEDREISGQMNKHQILKKDFAAVNVELYTKS
jgi:hypothetical protein